jgi:hypothetical protein
MHWARFDDHNMVPVRFDDRGNNTLNYVTLVACPRREGIEYIFGQKVLEEFAFHTRPYSNASVGRATG